MGHVCKTCKETAFDCCGDCGAKCCDRHMYIQSGYNQCGECLTNKSIAEKNQKILSIKKKREVMDSLKIKIQSLTDEWTKLESELSKEYVILCSDYNLRDIETVDLFNLWHTR